MGSKREEMHAWFAERQRAVAGDDAAAVNCERLASMGGDRAEEWRAAAEDSRQSAAENRARMSARLSGKNWQTPAERALEKHGRRS
jgi:hypothetical protein